MVFYIKRRGNSERVGHDLRMTNDEVAAGTLLRDQVDGALLEENWALAKSALGRMWAAAASPATAPFVVSRFERLRGHVPLTPCRIAVLRSFTVEPVVPLARACGFAGGIDCEFRVGDFNAFAQEILDPASWLPAWQPRVVILAAQARDIAPDLWDGFADLEEADVRGRVAEVSGRLVQLLETLRSRTDAHVVVHGLQSPPVPSRGILDDLGSIGQVRAIADINAALRNAARGLKDVFVLDYDALVSRHGANRWEDERKWHTVRLPIRAEHLVHMAREWLRFVHPITGRIAKCLVTDLDNTLWGGVIGEDGMGGIRIGDDAGGRPFAALQRVMLDLHRRGILLAIASKNNAAEANEAIASHGGMLLRPDHFAASRINWDDKATSLRGIAAELNIGLDALAFVDDNPVEREWVREQVPEVAVIELPADAGGFADAVRHAPFFERLSMTAEDRSRGRMYAEQRARAELQASVASVEDFYRSLGMEVVIETVRPETVARVAQLTQKTNQFNLTTRRCTEQQIEAEARDPACRVYVVRVKDRLGDNGIVGVAQTRDHDRRCEIGNLLLSCRVIGRTVETAMLARIAADARERGNATLAGWFVPTAKNAPARSFFEAHGFTVASEGSGGTHWERSLAAPGPECPPWIRLSAAAGDASS